MHYSCYSHISSQYHHPPLQGIRNMAAVTCHWCQVPIASYLVCFCFVVFTALSFCPIQSWNSLPLRCWLYVLWFFLQARTDCSYPSFASGVWRRLSFWANRGMLAFMPEVISWLNFRSRAVKGWKPPGKSYKDCGGLGLRKDRQICIWLLN